MITRILWMALFAGTLYGQNPGSAALRQPLVIENTGQFPEEIHYQILYGGESISVTDDSLWMSRRGESGVSQLRIRFEKARPFEIQLTGHSPTKVSYFLGSDPDKWRSDVPVYTGMRLKNLYQGVDLEFVPGGSGLEWRWIVEHGAKPPARNAIRIEGANAVLDNGNGFEIKTEAGDFELLHPGLFDSMGNRIGGKASSRNTGAADLIWNSYVNFVLTTPGARGVAINDEDGGVVMVGTIPSLSGFPVTTGVFQPTARGVDDGVILKLNATDGSLAFATFVGGTAGDRPNDVAIDRNRRIYVVGTTSSVDFPTSLNAPRRVGVLEEGFLLVLNPIGTEMVRSTLIGGDSVDEAFRVSIGPNMEVAVAGRTESSFLLSTENTGVGLSPGFAAVFRPNDITSPAIYLWLRAQKVNAVHLPASGDFLYVAGRSNDKPYIGGASIVNLSNARSEDNASSFGYIIKMDRRRAVKDLICVLPTTTFTEVRAVTTDLEGNITFAGMTTDIAYPTTTSSLRPSGTNYGDEGFVTRVRPDCKSMLFSTLLGSLGTTADSVNAIALDAGGNVYATGTGGAGFPTTANAFQPNAQGGKDAFVALLKNNGRQVLYGTLFGGLDDDQGQALAIRPDQTVVMAGTTKSPGLPKAVGSFHPALEGPEDLFVSRFVIEDPGAVSGYAFQDYNRNGLPDPYELPIAGLIVYRDLNRNGVLDGATEAFTGSQYLVAYQPLTNIPYIPAPNYSLGNLPVGSNLICASLAPTVAGQSTCKTVSVAFGATTQNVNFGLIPGQVGVSSLSPANASVKAGEKAIFELLWTHPERWRLLNDFVLRFVSEDGVEALQIRYVEATNKFSVYNDASGKYGPAFGPGEKPVLQTNLAQFHIEESTLQGSGPTGPSATWKLSVSFKPQAAGRTYNVLFLVSDDSGIVQGYEPLGTITVTR